MAHHIQATAPDGLNRQAGDTSISVVDGTPLKYHFTPETATRESYATAKILTRFRLCIETARLICQLSGIGGAAR